MTKEIPRLKAIKLTSDREADTVGKVRLIFENVQKTTILELLTFGLLCLF